MLKLTLAAAFLTATIGGGIYHYSHGNDHRSHSYGCWGHR